MKDLEADIEKVHATIFEIQKNLDKLTKTVNTFIGTPSEQQASQRILEDKDDLVNKRLDKLETKLDDLNTALKAEIDNLRDDLKENRAERREDIKEIRATMTHGFTDLKSSATESRRNQLVMIGILLSTAIGVITLLITLR